MMEAVEDLRAHASSSTSPPRAPHEESPQPQTESPSAPSAPTGHSTVRDDTVKPVARRRSPLRSPGESCVNSSDEDNVDSEASNIDAQNDFNNDVMDVSVLHVSDLLKDHAPDFSGELQRKVSRMQAISARTLTTWRKEWCVISHNFLVLFASRSDWTVRKCVLLSAVQSAQVKNNRGGVDNSRIFKILLNTRSASGKPLEKIVLRTPPQPKNTSGEGTSTICDAQRWVDEIQGRAALAAQSGGRLVPCMPFVDACQLVQRFQEDLHQAQEKTITEAQQKLQVAKAQVLARTIFNAIAAKLQLQLHGAFEVLVLHSRLHRWRELRRSGAVRRFVSGLEKPKLRYLRCSFLHWADLGNAEMRMAAAIFDAERKRAREKNIRLAALILTGLIRDWEETRNNENCRWVFLQLARQVQSTRNLKGGTGFWNMEKSSPIVSVSQRFNVAAQLLQAAIRHMQATRCESALRTWSIMATRCQQAEMQELIRATSELNQKLMDRCKEVPLESRLQGMVLSIRAAQLRRTLSAFVSWASMPCSVLAKSPIEQQPMANADTWKTDALRSALDGSPPPSPSGMCAVDKTEERFNFSPLGRHVDAST